MGKGIALINAGVLFGRQDGSVGEIASTLRAAAVEAIGGLRDRGFEVVAYTPVASDDDEAREAAMRTTLMRRQVALGGFVSRDSLEASWVRDRWRVEPGGTVVISQDAGERRWAQQHGWRFVAINRANLRIPGAYATVAELGEAVEVVASLDVPPAPAPPAATEIGLETPEAPGPPDPSPRPPDAPDRVPPPEPDETQRLLVTLIDEVRQLRRLSEREDFSLAKLGAGVVQILAAVMFLWGFVPALFIDVRTQGAEFWLCVARILMAIFLQLVTLTLFVTHQKR